MNSTSLSLQPKETASSSTGRSGSTSTIEDKALSLLGSGISAEATALALGVSASRISQLLATEEFSAQVAELRYQNLQSHNHRDATYDSIEDKLLGKLEKSLPLLLKPQDILKAIQTVNSAKRRGQSAPEQVSASTQIINLVLPTQIVQQFTKNSDNQVITAGDQNLVTMQSGVLLSKLESAKVSEPAPVLSSTPTEEIANEQTIKSPIAGANSE